MAKRGYESQKTGQKVDDLLDKIDNLNVPEWALQANKPSYTAQEVHALPENTSIPKKTSDLVNDRGFITQESDPTVPSWAKQPSKPTYTAEEVGALSEDTPLFSGDYNDLRNKPIIPTVPENVSAFNNDAGYLTSHQDISGKEDKSNKVTSLSAQSTDTQYPSAKAVYDELESKQDTINDLSTIRSGASAGATAYQKPNAGIPESDLSQGVKDKINEKEVFWAEYGVTTAQEIEQAVADGKMVFCSYGNHIYTLSNLVANQPILFSTFVSSTSRYYLTVNRSNDAWTSSSINHEIYNNKKTTLTGNESSNTYYPSTKAVADALAPKADIGDILFANFSRLTPKKTFEYDVSDTAYHPLFSRANTGISQLMSEVDDIVKFRITVTGTNIYARVDVVVRFQPALTPPCIMAWNEINSGTAAYSGIYQLLGAYPRTINSGNDWFLIFKNYNSSERHIRVEVFEDTENITWVETMEVFSYSSSTHSLPANPLYIYINRGLIANHPWQLVDAYVSTSNSAGFITNYLNTWMGGSLPLAGEALGIGRLGIMSGQKVYLTTNKNVAIDCDCGVFVLSANYSVNARISYTAARQKGYWTGITADPALTMDTFANGDQVYLRCTLGQDGKIYPDGHLSNVKSAGYTWVHIGTAASATAINLDTCGKPFITLNNDGKVTHINGTAVMDSSMSKWGVVSQTQTWTQASDGGYDYTMSDLQYGWIPQAIIMEAESVGAVFNEESGYFEMDGLTDISCKEILKTISAYPLISLFSWSGGAMFKSSKARIISGLSNSSYMSISWALNNNRIIETLNGAMNVNNISYAFQNCVHLKKTQRLYVTNMSTQTAINYAFDNCICLEDCELNGLKFNVSFEDSPRLSVASILYTINNSNATNAITITLHPTAYARAIADSDVQAALQAHTNVSLASAT